MLDTSVAVMYGTDAGEDTVEAAGTVALPEAVAEAVAEALLEEELVETAQYLSLEYPSTTPAMYWAASSL